jgi:hypothetical protein
LKRRFSGVVEEAVLGDEAAVAEPEGLLAGVDVGVQAFADEHRLAEAGLPVHGVLLEVVRDERHQRVGCAGAAAEAGAAVVVLDAGGLELSAGEGATGLINNVVTCASHHQRRSRLRARGWPLPPRAGGAPGVLSMVRWLMVAVSWTGTLPCLPPRPSSR